MCSLVRKQWGLILFCLPLYAMEQKVAPKEIEQTSPLCTASDNVLSTICDHLDTWKDIHALGLTCRNLDRRATVQDKRLAIRVHKEIGSPVPSPDDFKTPARTLNSVLSLIHRIVAKKGRNLIDLDLGCTNVGADKKQFSKFLAACCAPEIVNHLIELSLVGNNITRLPREITGLTHLKSLCLTCNTLDQKSLRRVSQMKSLNDLWIGYNNLSELPAEFSQLTDLKWLEIPVNKLSFEAIKPLLGLTKLARLNVQGNPLSYRSLWNLLNQKQWPLLKEVFAMGIDRKEEDYYLPEPPGIDVTIG